MALYFISGVSGTGKSMLMEELRTRGCNAQDTDTLCFRRSKISGKSLNYEQAKAEGGYDWIYPSEALSALKVQSESEDIFLFGIVDNFDEVIAAADTFVWMAISLELLHQRLDTRAKLYGKTDSERDIILATHKKMTDAIPPGTFILDASKPVEILADELLDYAAVGRIK